jgi:transposase
MAKPYSQDLRDRVIDAVKRGEMSRRAAARRYEISESVAIKWLERLERHGSREPVGHGGHRASKLMPHRAFLEGLRAEKSDVTLQALCDRLSAERGVKADTSMMSRFFRKIGVTFKNVWPAPSARGLSRLAADQSASTYPASRNSLRPRWRYARSGPHKSPGVERRFLNQDSEAPFDCQAISSSPSRKHPQRPAVSPDRRTPYAALGIPVATNRSPRRRTAQAIRASLLAKATTATLR